MRIIDTFLTKSIAIKTNDLYTTAMDIIAILSKYGRVRERKNLFGTDGPRKSLEMQVEIIKPFDKQSKMKLSFNFNGESNGTGVLELSIVCKFRMKIDKEGLVTETFADYYAQNILPSTRKRAEEETTRLIEEVEEKIQKSFVIM